MPKSARHHCASPSPGIASRWAQPPSAGAKKAAASLQEVLLEVCTSEKPDTASSSSSSSSRRVVERAHTIKFSCKFKFSTTDFPTDQSGSRDGVGHGCCSCCEHGPHAPRRRVIGSAATLSHGHSTACLGRETAGGSSPPHMSQRAQDDWGLHGELKHSSTKTPTRSPPHSHPRHPRRPHRPRHARHARQGGTHAGKYEFDSRFSGVTSFNYDSSVILGDRAGGGNRILAKVESDVRPTWASRDVAVHGAPGLQGSIRVVVGEGLGGAAQVTVVNEEISWEPFYVSLVRGRSHQTTTSATSCSPSPHHPPPALHPCTAITHHFATPHPTLHRPTPPPTNTARSVRVLRHLRCASPLTKAPSPLAVVRPTRATGERRRIQIA